MANIVAILDRVVTPKQKWHTLNLENIRAYLQQEYGGRGTIEITDSIDWSADATPVLRAYFRLVDGNYVGDTEIGDFWLSGLTRDGIPELYGEW